MLQLVIGNQRYSSWSFRPWLLLKQAGIPFREIKLKLHQKDSFAKMRRYSPGGRVPVLIDGRATVWESTAICEHVAEKFPAKALWPKEPAARAEARSVSHEMHAGFQGLRQNLPCHFLNRYRDFTVPAEAKPDIERVREIWAGCRAKYGKGGPFLFGSFTIADAMFAPVVFRFLAYGVKTGRAERAYMETIERLPATRDWLAAAKKEKERIPAYERGKV